MLKILSIAAIAATVAFAGVAATPVTADAAQYRNCDAAKHKGRNGGAILGALAGQALGGNTKSTVIGAGVGAVAGHNIRYSNCKKRNQVAYRANRHYARHNYHR
jgi:predicted lipid-binding transport protein (Tim44 family)